MYRENLKKIRTELNLSAQKLADKMGVSQGSIAQYESGKREPNFKFISKLNTVLNVNLNWFVTSEGEMFNPPQFEQVEKELAQIVDERLKKYGLI